MAKKRILLFTIPNDGHLNILKLMIKRYEDDYDFKVVIIGRKNTKPDLKKIEEKTVLLAQSAQFKNTPASCVFRRVLILLDECLKVTKEFNPDLIIYDFPAIEGYFVGKILNIPYWTSIPGMIGPYIHQKYLKRNLSTKINKQAILDIKNKYGISVHHSDIEVISNCLHIPAQINLLWSYRSITPHNFMQNRIKAKYVFVGYLKDRHLSEKIPKNGVTRVYFSLGTEVMDNLWVNQRKTRSQIKKVIGGISEKWKKRKIKVTYVTQGKRVLNSYPNNWKVFHKVKQQKILKEVDVFITHGGSNSFHEAVLLQVPMVLIPFFGDQPLVSKRAEKLGVGINLVENDYIEKRKTMSFLNESLVKKIDEAINTLSNEKKYQANLRALRLNHTRLRSLINESI